MGKQRLWVWKYRVSGRAHISGWGTHGNGHFAEGGAQRVQALGPRLPLNPATFPIFQAAGVPQALHSKGSLSWGPCEFDLAAGLHSDYGDAHLQLARISGPQTSVLGHLTHSLPLLGHLGLPPKNAISLMAQPGPATLGSLALQMGPCQLQGTLEHHAGNRSTWMLATKPGCPLLEVRVLGQ